MVALVFSRAVMFAIRAIPAPLHRTLDGWAQRQALKRRARRLRQTGR
jgi:hypothetical protein